MAVKSYGWYWALHSTRRTPSGQCYDVRDTTADQVYVPGSAASSTSAAVDRTWGTRMTRSGNILQAHYCSTTTACGAWVAGNWMSQNGSRDQAQAGRGYRAILRSYYRDIAITP
jgi:peptidoglycan hydrolase-like amidase